MAGYSVAPLLRGVTNPQSTHVKHSTVAFGVGGGGEEMTRGGFRGRPVPDGAF